MQAAFNLQSVYFKKLNFIELFYKMLKYTS